MMQNHVIEVNVAVLLCKYRLDDSHPLHFYKRGQRDEIVKGHYDAAGEVRVVSRGQEIVTVASQGDRFKCISCVPICQPQT